MLCFWKNSCSRNDFTAYNCKLMSLERLNHVGALARTFSQRLKTGALSNFTLFFGYNPSNTQLNCNLKLLRSQSFSSHGRVVFPQRLFTPTVQRLTETIVKKSLVFLEASDSSRCYEGISICHASWKSKFFVLTISGVEDNGDNMIHLRWDAVVQCREDGEVSISVCEGFHGDFGE